MKKQLLIKKGKIKLKRNHSHVNVLTSKNESLAIIYYITKNGLYTYNNMLFSTLAMKKINQYHNNETNNDNWIMIVQILIKTLNYSVMDSWLEVKEQIEVKNACIEKGNFYLLIKINKN